SETLQDRQETGTAAPSEFLEEKPQPRAGLARRHYALILDEPTPAVHPVPISQSIEGIEKFLGRGNERFPFFSLGKIEKPVEERDTPRLQEPTWEIDRNISRWRCFQGQRILPARGQIRNFGVMAAHQYASAEAFSARQAIEPRH